MAIARAPKVEAWVDQNPLRIWRLEKKKTQADIGRRVKKSRMAIQCWEDGTSSPSDDSFSSIARMMNVKLADLKDRWRSWREAMPS